MLPKTITQISAPKHNKRSKAIPIDFNNLFQSILFRVYLFHLYIVLYYPVKPRKGAEVLGGQLLLQDAPARAVWVEFHHIILFLHNSQLFPKASSVWLRVSPRKRGCLRCLE